MHCSRQRHGQTGVWRGFLSLFDQVLLQRSAAKIVTKESSVLPEKSQGKLLQATGIAIGQALKERVERFNQLA